MVVANRPAQTKENVTIWDNFFHSINCWYKLLDSQFDIVIDSISGLIRNIEVSVRRGAKLPICSKISKSQTDVAQTLRFQWEIHPNPSPASFQGLQLFIAMSEGSSSQAYWLILSRTSSLEFLVFVLMPLPSILWLQIPKVGDRTISIDMYDSQTAKYGPIAQVKILPLCLLRCSSVRLSGAEVSTSFSVTSVLLCRLRSQTVKFRFLGWASATVSILTCEAVFSWPLKFSSTKAKRL